MKYLMRKSLFFGWGVVLVLGAVASVEAQKPYGIDVFAGNGVITWTTVKSADISFAWAKATEGEYYEDTNFVRNQVDGKAAGVYMGAYDFCRPDLYSPSEEANYFWNFAKNYILNDGKTLMPMLDFETFNGVTGASSYADWVNQWCYDVQTNAAAAGVGVTPVVYCSACSGACDLDSEDAIWGAWIANYNGESPQSGTPWNECTTCEAWGTGVWNFWQFTSTTNVPGVPGTYSSGYCDADVFNGTNGGLLKFLAGAIAVTGAPTNTTVDAGGTATFQVAASASGNPLTYQWRFNQVNIPGATNSIYSITNVQITDAGGYSVMITNSSGNVTTSPGFLSVIGPLVNAPNSALDPANMINWWTADGNPFDIYGVTNASISGGFSYTNGEVGLAFRFDGSSAYLSTSGGEMAPPWTVCAWIYRQNAPGVSAALLGDTTFAVKLEQYGHTSDVGFSESGVADYYFNAGLSAGVWSHLAITYSGSVMEFYVNGAPVTSQLYSGGSTVATPSSLDLPRSFIGVDTFSGSPSDYALGAVDELQIYNSALSASEIASIYNAGSAGLVRAAQFTGVTNTASGQVQLNLIGQTGKSITLYSSTNLLSNWTSQASISNPTGATNYVVNPTNSAAFFLSSQKY